MAISTTHVHRSACKDTNTSILLFFVTSFFLPYFTLPPFLLSCSSFSSIPFLLPSHSTVEGCAYDCEEHESESGHGVTPSGRNNKSCKLVLAVSSQACLSFFSSLLISSCTDSLPPYPLFIPPPFFFLLLLLQLVAT